MQGELIEYYHKNCDGLAFLSYGDCRELENITYMDGSGVSNQKVVCQFCKQWIPNYKDVYTEKDKQGYNYDYVVYDEYYMQETRVVRQEIKYSDLKFIQELIQCSALDAHIRESLEKKLKEQILKSMYSGVSTYKKDNIVETPPKEHPNKAKMELLRALEYKCNKPK